MTFTIVVRRRLSLTIQPDGIGSGSLPPAGWLREEKMLNAAKTIVNNTAGRNWERQHAAGIACRPQVG